MGKRGKLSGAREEGKEGEEEEGERRGGERRERSVVKYELLTIQIVGFFEIVFD